MFNFNCLSCSGRSLDLKKGMRAAPSLVAAGLTALTLVSHQSPLVGQVSTDPSLVFRSGVDLVSVAAVVRDRRGQVVRDLTARDFEVYDNGVRRPIVEFAPGEDGPISVALLIDISGSMRVARTDVAARGMLDHLLAWLDATRDEAALFTFDAKRTKSMASRRTPRPCGRRWPASTPMASRRSTTRLARRPSAWRPATPAGGPSSC